MPEPTLAISVIICTRNRPQDIVWALPSVLKNTYPHYDVTVVDQSDDRETEAIVTGHIPAHPNLRYLRTDTRGLSYARNLGIESVSGEVIAFTDDDCETGTDWVADIAKLFQSEPDLALLYGQVHMPKELDGKAVAVPCLYFDQRRVLRDGEVLGMGANMAFRRSLYDQVGGYDLALGGGAVLPGAEDFDFSYRAQRLGAKVVADPSLILVHRTYREAEQWRRVAYLCAIGDAAFYAKHARCGDGHALLKLWGRLAYFTAKSLLKPAARRGVDPDYLRGYWQGIWKSRRFPIDRRKKLYVITTR